MEKEYSNMTNNRCPKSVPRSAWSHGSERFQKCHEKQGNKLTMALSRMPRMYMNEIMQKRVALNMAISRVRPGCALTTELITKLVK